MTRTLDQWRTDFGAQWYRAGDKAHGTMQALAISTDSRSLRAGEIFLGLRGPRYNGGEFAAAAADAGAVAAIVGRDAAATAADRAPALPLLVVDDSLSALQHAARACRARYTGKVVAVAGSNGKTTVKEMLANILARSGPTLATAGNLNNHLGVPLTLLRLDGATRFAVIEVGANHPGEVQELAALVRPDVGIVTNAGAEHLEGFGTLEGAARAEGELFESLGPDGVAIINAEDPFAPLWRQQAAKTRVMEFGLKAPADVHAAAATCAMDVRGFVSRFALIAPQGRTEIELMLAGMHNVVNAAGAAAAALAAGADLDAVRSGLATMRAVKGRLQFKRCWNGAWLLDDTYNANPSSMQAAIDVLAALDGPRWFVAGAMGELGAAAVQSHRELGDYAREHGVSRLLGFGTDTQLTVEQFGAGAEWFGDIESLQRRLGATLTPEVRLLVKGSRSNKLERVVDFLVAGPVAQAEAS